MRRGHALLVVGALACGVGRAAGEDPAATPAPPADVAALAHGLAAADPELRRRAAYGLALLGGEAAPAAEALARALQDDDDYVRETAGRALAKLARDTMGAALRPALPALLEGLAHARVLVRKEAVSLLLQAWEASAEPRVRGPLSYLFAVLGPAAKEAAPLLRPSLAASPLEPPQLYALARIAASPEDVAAVVTRLVREVEADGPEALMAELTLGRLGASADAARVALRARVEGRPEPDLWAALALCKIGGEGSEVALEQVRQALSGAKPDAALHQMDEFDEAAQALIGLAPDVLAVLLEARTDGARGRAAHALAAWTRRFGAESVRGALPLLDASMPRLEQLLHDPEPRLRLAVADWFDALAAH